MIIDVHTHIARIGSFAKKSFKETLADLLKEMKANKIDLAFLLPYFRPIDDSQMLDETLELAKGVKEVRVFGTIDMTTVSKVELDRLDECLRKKLIIGVKMYLGYQPVYPYDERMRPVYELCQKYGVPAMFHTGDTYRKDARVKYAHPLHIDEVAVNFPDLKIVIAHMGNPWVMDCAEVVYKNKNVYADISGLGLDTMQDANGEFVKKRIQEFIAFASPRKLLYGTDWPLVPMKSYLKFARSLGIKKDDMEYVLWKNAAALFSLNLK